MRRNLYLSVFLYCIMLCLFFTGTALAHKVTVFAWVEGNMVYGDSKFSGGKKARNAEVIVWDESGKELLRTRTDDNGEFSFPVPGKTAMRIELLAGMGHKADWTIPLEDLEGVDIAESLANETAALAPADTTEPETAQTAAPQVSAPVGIDPAQLEAIVEKAVSSALNKKITPLTKIVADLEQDGPTVNDIMGGIGYIFGLMGVAMYFKAKKR